MHIQDAGTSSNSLVWAKCRVPGRALVLMLCVCVGDAGTQIGEVVTTIPSTFALRVTGAQERMRHAPLACSLTPRVSFRTSCHSHRVQRRECDVQEPQVPR